MLTVYQLKKKRTCLPTRALRDVPSRVPRWTITGVRREWTLRDRGRSFVGRVKSGGSSVPPRLLPRRQDGSPY